MRREGLTVTMVFLAESANYGEGIGNISTLKKMSRGNHEQYSYISRQAMRYNIVRQADWDQTPVDGKSGVVQFAPSATIVEYPEIDLFGYMKTVAKDGDQKGGASTRSAVVRLSNAIALEPFLGNLEFLTNMGLAARGKLENEIAQSEACNDEKFANYWMHNAFLNIDNKKMSKSAGNFFTVREISEKYPLQVIRFFMLSAHYRSPLNFSDTLVEASKNGLERILTAIDHLREVIAAAPEGELNVEDQKNLEEANALKAKYEAAMEDDFNTADAIAAIFELVKYANTTATAESSKEYLRGLLDRIVKLGDVLGLILDKKEELLDADIEKLIEERQAARKAKDFAKADAIRDELLEKGIILKDTREGVQWKKA